MQRNSMRKRVLATCLCCIMTVGMMPTGALSAFAEPYESQSTSSGSDQSIVVTESSQTHVASDAEMPSNIANIDGNASSSMSTTMQANASESSNVIDSTDAVSTLGLTAQDTTTYNDDTQGLTYTLDPDAKTATVCAYSGTAKVIVIPGSVTVNSTEYTVVDFGTVFKGTAIEQITIPKSVTALSANAFSACKSLTKATFEDGFNVEISSACFKTCTALTEVDNVCLGTV